MSNYSYFFKISFILFFFFYINLFNCLAQSNNHPKSESLPPDLGMIEHKELKEEREQQNLNYSRSLSSIDYRYSDIVKNVEFSSSGLMLDDPFYYLQWQFSQSTLSLFDNDLDIEDAWNYTNDGFTSNGDTIVIAVIDEGVNRDHEDLVNSIWYNKNEIPNNMIDDDKNGYIDDYWGWNSIEQNDNINNNGLGHWHGTPIAGIIGAETDNELGVSGVNRNIKIMNIVKGQSISSIIEAYSYILSMRKLYNESKGKLGAFVVAINCSWGKDDLKAIDNPIWCSIYDSLGKEGVLTVVSAPNSNIDIDSNNDMPSDCLSQYIISVTNTNQYDKKVFDAGFGKSKIDLGAPGDNSYTTSNTGDYGYFGGTSAAAPYVTAAIGLLYAVDSYQLSTDIIERPALVAANMKKYILNGVHKISDLEGRSTSGGRLNIMNSVLELSNDYEIKRPHQDDFFKVLSFENENWNGVLVRVFLEEQSWLKYELLDVNGRHIDFGVEVEMPAGIHGIEIGDNDLSSGVYFIKWVVQNKVYGTRILKL